MLNKISKIAKDNLYAVSLYTRQISGTVVLFLIARYLTVYDYGLFSSYKNIAGYLFLLANLNYHDYILVSTKAEQSKVRQKITIFMLHAICLALAFAAISLFCNLENHFLFILVIIRTFFDITFFALVLPYFQAAKKFTVIAWINIIYSIGISIVAIISFLFKLSLAKFLILNIFLGIINFVQCSYYVKINYFGAITKLKKYLQLLDKSLFGYMGTGIMANLYAPLPSLYIAMFVPKEQAALYFAALTITSVASLLISAQEQKIKPQLIKADIVDAKKIIKNYTLFILSITCGMLLFMILFGKLVLLLVYGQEIYTSAYGILLLLLLGNILYGMTFSYGIYITAKGYQPKTIPMRFEFIICCVLTLFIFSKFGIYGAAISNLITMAYMLIRYKIFSDRLFKIQKC